MSDFFEVLSKVKFQAARLMTKMLSIFTRTMIFLFAVTILMVTACSSNVTKIERYGLNIMDEAPASWGPSTGINNTASAKTIVLYPIRLPSYLNTPSIVSRTETQKVRVSRGHVWAGDLESEATRVLGANLLLLLPDNHVLRFPWGQNIEPDYSIRISVDELSGERGGEVVLKAQWQIFSSASTGYSNEIYKAEFKEQALSESYDDYVAALNRLIEKLSLTLASKTKLLLEGQHLNKSST